MVNRKYAGPIAAEPKMPIKIISGTDTDSTEIPTANLELWIAASCAS